ncbi:MAG: histidinol phosphatase [Rhizobacter sp.]|nr:histidinol phosphatase [Ferruginibacter sp.]
MFNFFKKKETTLSLPDYLPFQTDIHSHILAGIDDGSPDIATSLQLVKGIYDLGIRKTVATPHVIGDIYRNSPDTINLALEELRAACVEEKINIEINAAAEYMLDDYFLKLLQDEAPLLAIHKNIILTEQSYASSSNNLNEIAFAIMTKGYRAIMAHPERYFYYHNNYESYGHLKDMGFYLQVNVLSLTGYYGKSVAKAAKYILDNDMADFVGTDMHHTRHLAILQKKESLELFKRHLDKRTYNVLSDY